MTEQQIKHHIMQPCCVDNYLPRAIMQAPHRALSFHTYGDVTMEKFFRAVSYLVGASSVLVLSMPVVAPDTVVFMQQCFERGWISDLVLSTSRDASGLIDLYLKDYKQHVLYTYAQDVSNQSSHLVLYNHHKALSITGPMFDSTFDRHFSAYTMLFHESFATNSPSLECGNPLLNILYPDIARHRLAYQKASRASAESPLSSTLHDFLERNLPPYEQD